MSQKDGFTRILQFYGTDCNISATPLINGVANQIITSIPAARLPAGYYRVDLKYGMAPEAGGPAVRYNNAAVYHGENFHGYVFTLPIKGQVFYDITHIVINGTDDLIMRLVAPEGAGIVHNGYLCAIRVK